MHEAFDVRWEMSPMGKSSPDADMALVFRRHKSEHMLYPAGDCFADRLRGMTPGRGYDLQLESTGEKMALKGRELARGLEVRLPAPESAEMITYRNS